MPNREERWSSSDILSEIYAWYSPNSCGEEVFLALASALTGLRFDWDDGLSEYIATPLRLDEELLPCPFCMQVPEISKHHKEDLWRLGHVCPIVGTISIDWMNSREALCLLWNTRGIVDAARKGSPSTIPDSHA
jgi:hypothetical protein